MAQWAAPDGLRLEPNGLVDSGPILGPLCVDLEAHDAPGLYQLLKLQPYLSLFSRCLAFGRALLSTVDLVTHFT